MGALFKSPTMDATFLANAENRLKNAGEATLQGLEKYSPQNVDTLVDKHATECFSRLGSGEDIWIFRQRMRNDLIDYGVLLRGYYHQEWSDKKTDELIRWYQMTYHEAIYDGKLDPWTRRLATENDRENDPSRGGWWRHIVDAVRHRTHAITGHSSLR